MKLILEVCGKTQDEETGEVPETIIHSEVVRSKEEAIKRKNELQSTYENATFYLHYCRHDEHKPCTREKI